MNIEEINIYLKFLSQMPNAGGSSVASIAQSEIYYKFREKKIEALNKIISEPAQKDVYKLASIKKEVGFLILADLQQIINECKKSNLDEVTSKKIAELAHMNLQHAFIDLFENNKVSKAQFIEAKKRLFSIVIDKSEATNEVKETLKLTLQEEEFLKQFPFFLRNAGMPYYSYLFIQAFTSLLYIITYINNNLQRRNELLNKINNQKNIPSPKGIFSIFKSFPKIEEKKIYDNQNAAWKEGGLLVDKKNSFAINLTQKEANSLIDNFPKGYDILTGIVGVYQASGNVEAVGYLVNIFIEEIEREAVRLINAIKGNSAIPIIANYERPENSERLIRIPFRGYDFVSKEDLKLWFKSDNGYINYSLDFDANSDNPINTLTKKDILGIINHIMHENRVPFMTMWEKGEILYEEYRKIAFQLVELKWHLKIKVPISIYSLKDGNLAGSLKNMVKVEVEQYVDLFVQYFAFLLNQDFNDMMNYIRPMINVYGVPNETHHGDFNKYSTEPIEDPEITEIDVQKIIDRLE